MTLFDEPSDWDAEYRECRLCGKWVPKRESLGPDACTSCGTKLLTGVQQ